MDDRSLWMTKYFVNSSTQRRWLAIHDRRDRDTNQDEMSTLTEGQAELKTGMACLQQLLAQQVETITQHADAELKKVAADREQQATKSEHVCARVRACVRVRVRVCVRVQSEGYPKTRLLETFPILPSDWIRHPECAIGKHRGIETDSEGGYF